MKVKGTIGRLERIYAYTVDPERDPTAVAYELCIINWDEFDELDSNTVGYPQYACYDPFDRQIKVWPHLVKGGQIRVCYSPPIVQEILKP